MQLPRVLAAPMAGGPTTPALVNAVSFGFLALGSCTPAQAREWLAECQAPFGANLFLPQEELLLDDAHVVATSLNTTVPDVDLTNGFEAKFAAVCEAAPAIVASMFGCFTSAQIDQLHEAGSEAWATVTNPRDAQTAKENGVDGLIVQGPLAGGHRGTWTVTEDPDERSLEQLLDEIVPMGLPVIAAGGVRVKGDVDKLLALGAVAVSCGTAFLLADEAGTSERNRELLRGDRASVLSRAFSGRWARGLESEFTREHPDMPPVYPYLRPMTSDNDYCLVGADRGELMEAPAGEIERLLTSGPESAKE
ncbi:NAD(P)H-dependent flavin oxidoreductase [Corynebacterium glaucum]|nr:nitronate monooxygenase [Corynebacterium glaucum]